MSSLAPKTYMMSLTAQQIEQRLMSIDNMLSKDVIRQSLSSPDDATVPSTAAVAAALEPISQVINGLGDLAAKDSIGLDSTETSGVLPISKGGSGGSNLTEAQQNLGILSESEIQQLINTSIPTIQQVWLDSTQVNGVLPLAKGGTGSSSPSQALKNLGIHDSNGKVPVSQLPAVAITDTFPVSSQAAMLALSAEKGDVAIRTDLNKSFILMQEPASSLSNWKELLNDAEVKLTPQIRESLRRSYAETGFNLVNGSFEVGGVLVNANDVLVQESSGRAFSGPAGTVVAGTDPNHGGFVDISPIDGFSHSLRYGPASAGYRLKFTTYVTDAPYFADPTGMVPFRQSAQNAIDAVHASGGGVVVIPTGNFLMDTTPLVPRNNVRILGFGDTSRIVVNTDMRTFEYLAPTVSSALFGFELEYLFIDNTVSGTRSNYDVYIENPNFCRFTKVRIKSGHTDTDYSSTNVGGIHLTKSVGSTTTSFCNWLDDCWVQNNSLWLENLTDSRVKGGYVWGHTRQFAIRITGGGANAVEHVMGIIPSKFNGGIWLDGAGVNQIRIIGNEFDGNPLLDTGAGIYAPQQIITATILGNTFWGCDKQGIHLVDPVGVTATGNNFWKCNAADAGYDDILIEGKTFTPTSNIFSGNSHVIDDPRTNKGRAYHELNSGFTPILNSVTGCGIAGNYLEPAILAPGVPGQETTIDNCVGGGMNGITQKPNNVRTKRTVTRSAEGNLAPGGYLVLEINTESQFGSVGGYTGIVSVSATRQNYTPQSINETMAVASRGLTVNKNVITTIGGADGSPTYTLTVTTPGNLVFTNTSTEIVDVRVSFDGVTSLA